VGAVLDELIALQCGIVTRRQCLDAGLSLGTIRHKLRSGQWQRIWEGVFATFSGPLPRPAQLWAAALNGGEGAVLSHHTAAELWGLIKRPAPVIHVTIPARRLVSAPPGVVVHRSGRVERARHPSLRPPRTRVEETILDLTQLETNLDNCYAWLARGVNARLTTVERLLDAMAQRPYLRHRRLLREGLGDVASGCRSVLEWSYLHRVERAHGLPAGERQVPVRRGTAHQFLDVRYPHYRTRVELDGRAAHPFHERFRDMRRDNAGVRAGDATLRYGTADVAGRPCDVAREVAEVLRAHGWTGAYRSCGQPGCPMIT
jgi:very-short-patch-repair endonuclease